MTNHLLHYFAHLAAWCCSRWNYFLRAWPFCCLLCFVVALQLSEKNTTMQSSNLSDDANQSSDKIALLQEENVLQQQQDSLEEELITIPNENQLEKRFQYRLHPTIVAQRAQQFFGTEEAQELMGKDAEQQQAASLVDKIIPKQSVPIQIVTASKQTFLGFHIDSLKTPILPNTTSANSDSERAAPENVNLRGGNYLLFRRPVSAFDSNPAQADQRKRLISSKRLFYLLAVLDIVVLVYLLYISRS